MDINLLGNTRERPDSVRILCGHCVKLKIDNSTLKVAGPCRNEPICLHSSGTWTTIF